MQSHILTAGTFKEIHNGTGACVMQVKRGVAAIHVGSGTPSAEVTITFAAGEKFMLQDGNQLRATSGAGATATVVIGVLNG